VEGKTVTETFATPAALRKAQQEVADFHRFRELSQNLVDVNEKICRYAASKSGSDSGSSCVRNVIAFQDHPTIGKCRCQSTSG
jgi:hypothetical protein